MTGHRLDRVVWEALSACHLGLAEGDGFAQRYAVAVAPFAATQDDSLRSYRDLGDLLGAEDRAALVTVTEVGEPPGLTAVRRDVVDQMVFDRSAQAAESSAPVRLQTADVPAMMSLAETTRPGPFASRTIEMGCYLGVKVDGALVAMAGERMRLDGFTEVSAVCVDPAHRGQGLAADLINALCRSIFAQGNVPFLHVFASNAAAIELYRKLGFVRRRQLHLTVMKRLSGLQ